MKSFFYLFKNSFDEMKNVRCLAITGIFITVSMIIEAFSIDFVLFKINFAFIAIAVIGMLFGPTVGFVAGLACDIVGFAVHPQGGFLPIYVLVAGLQGLIYGLVLYQKRENASAHKPSVTALMVRALIARSLDVIIINIFINTRLNMYYGFIPDTIYSDAIKARVIKNVLELLVDIPLLYIILPVALTAYNRIIRSSIAKKA